MDDWYASIALFWSILAIPIFFILLKVKVPYGKFSENNPLHMVPIPSWLGWMIMESPTLVVGVLLYRSGNPKLTSNPYILFFVALFWLHYINRTVIFPLYMKSSSSASSSSKASSMSLLTITCGFTFQLVNCYLIFDYLFNHANPAKYVGWVHDARYLLGVSLFFVGAAVNIHSDSILLQLRQKKSPNAKSGTRYSIPRGGMFEYVSSANYFGEIIEWLGFAIVTWSLAGLIFFEWTLVNLVPRALSTHKYYLQIFKDYPKNRRAVIPFVW